jgi:hypothetical protein
MDIEAEIYAAERDYEAALNRIRNAKAGAAGSAEGQLGQAYQRLVRAGARPQLKLKYRGR